MLRTPIRLTVFLACILCIFLNMTIAQEKPIQDVNNTAVRSMVNNIPAEDKEMVLEYIFDAPAISASGDYYSVTINALDNYLSQPGAPIIPVRPVKILVPYGKQVINCQVIAKEVQKLPGSFVLPPVQQSYPLSYEGVIKQTLPDSAIYKSNKLWPGKYYEEIGTQWKRGYQLLILNLFPLQYVPAKGRISYASKLILTVNLADSNEAEAVKPTKAVKERLKHFVDNPDSLQSYPITDSEVFDNTLNVMSQSRTTEVSVSQMDSGMEYGLLSLPQGGPYKYIIITNESLKNAPGPWNFQALCNAKIAKGIPAAIFTTQWIYANYSGTKPNGGSDNQTKIRNFLIDAYNNWGTEYVLLGGTASIVPARSFWVYANPYSTYMPADMYYGCLDSTFDYDADGVYGEPYDDVDLYAEIYVGRAPVSTPAEVANFVKKTLTYDTTQGTYLSRIAMLGEYLGFGGVSQYATNGMEEIRWGSGNTRGFENHNQPNFFDFTTTGYLQSIYFPLYDSSNYNWPKANLLSLMNNGIHCFSHLGHANTTYCMKLNNSNLGSLTNSDYFFVYSEGCYPGAFDSTNCFAEVLTTSAKGAFGTIMNARYGWGARNSTDGPSHFYARQFWDAALGEGILEIGRANQDSKEDLAWNINGDCMRWCYYELNLFGDPQQEFRFEDVSANTSFMNACNSQGNATLHFDDAGNLVLTGTLTIQASCTQTGISGQKIWASNGTTVVAIMDGGTGNMWIAGSCHERQDSMSLSNAAHIVKASNDNVLAYIDTSGDLYLKGRVYQATPTGTSTSSTLHVPSQYATIQAAVDDANNGDTILVADGNYSAGATITNKYLTIQGDINNPEECVINVQNSNRAFYFGESTNGSIISGLKIINGSANYGSAVCFIDNNDVSEISVENCIISDCHSTVDGGAIYNLSNKTTTLLLKNCTITACSADANGGAIYSYLSDIQDCNISNNLCDYDGSGGGIFNVTNATIRNSILAGNSCQDSNGGAIYLHSGNLYVDECNLYGNSASKGGGIYVSNFDHLNIEKSIILQNIAEYDGGGIYLNNGPEFSEIRSCVIADNNAQYGYGGGIYADANVGGYWTNLTIAHNIADCTGGGLYSDANNVSLTVKNSIFSENQCDTAGKNIYFDGQTDALTISYCQLPPDVNNQWVYGPINDSNNATADPCFVNAGANDFRLDPNSPCINTGDPNDDYYNVGYCDIGSGDRIYNGIVDKGAYEYDPNS